MVAQKYTVQFVRANDFPSHAKTVLQNEFLILSCIFCKP